VILLYVFSGVAVAVMLAAGAGFYRTPLLERAHHEGYWPWKAGGPLRGRSFFANASFRF
jgi:hypothetical protein